MSMGHSSKAFWLLAVVLIALAVAVGLVWPRRAAHPPMAASPPATAPTTRATSKPAPPAPPPPRDLLGIIRANNPAYPTTQELETPASYDQAAHLIIDQPLYLCPMGHEWITDPRGQSIASALADPGAANSHVVTDKIVFIHWQISEAGKWIASAIRKNADGHFDLVQAKRTTPLAANRHWLWDRALAWDDKIVVPTDRGVSVFSVNDPNNESYQAAGG